MLSQNALCKTPIDWFPLYKKDTKCKDFVEKRFMHWQILDRRTDKTQRLETTWNAEVFKTILDCHRNLVLEIGGAAIDGHFAKVMMENFQFSNL